MFTCKNNVMYIQTSYTRCSVSRLHHDNTCRFVMFTCKECAKLVVGMISLSGGVILHHPVIEQFDWYTKYIGVYIYIYIIIIFIFVYVLYHN